LGRGGRYRGREHPQVCAQKRKRAGHHLASKKTYQ
jgi:hypothetical protein